MPPPNSQPVLQPKLALRQSVLIILAMPLRAALSGAVAVLPIALIYWSGGSIIERSVGAGDLLVDFLSLITDFTAQAIITYGGIAVLRGHSASLVETLSYCSARLLPLFAISALTTVATQLGAVILIVPGIVIMIVSFVALPAAMAENLGVADSFRRSINLTAGNRLQVFGTVLAAAAILLVIALVGLILFDAAHDRRAEFVLVAVLSWLASIAGAALSAACYVQLRLGKEGDRESMIRRVFE